MRAVDPTPAHSLSRAARRKRARAEDRTIAKHQQHMIAESLRLAARQGIAVRISPR